MSEITRTVVLVDEEEHEVLITYSWNPGYRGYRNSYGVPEEPDEPEGPEDIEVWLDGEEISDQVDMDEIYDYVNSYVRGQIEDAKVERALEALERWD